MPEPTPEPDASLVDAVRSDIDGVQDMSPTPMQVEPGRYETEEVYDETGKLLRIIVGERIPEDGDPTKPGTIVARRLLEAVEPFRSSDMENLRAKRRPQEYRGEDEHWDWTSKLTVRKYASQKDYEAGVENAPSVEAKNLLLDEGAALILSLLIGGAGQVCSNANARIGVGDSNTSASAAQTGLQGSNTLYRVMEAGYPTLVSRTLTFRSVFGASEANFDWREATIDNGAGVNLNRVVAGAGTKVSGAVWTADFEASL